MTRGVTTRLARYRQLLWLVRDEAVTSALEEMIEQAEPALQSPGLRAHGGDGSRRDAPGLHRAAARRGGSTPTYHASRGREYKSGSMAGD